MIDLRPAAHRGVLRVDAEALQRVNCVEYVSGYTWYDGQVVDAGNEVGAAKVTPLAVAETNLRAVERIARECAPLVDVAAFRRHRVGMVVSEQLDERGMVCDLDVLEAALTEQKLDRLFHEIELPLIPVLARMEATGVALALADHGQLPAPPVPARWDSMLLLSGCGTAAA